MTCHKRRYRDRIAALVALADTGYTKKPKREECRAYHCPICGSWHLTSKPRGRNGNQEAANA